MPKKMTKTLTVTRSGEENSRMYELQTDWANTISNAITNGNKPKDIEENQYNFADLDRNRDGKID